MGAETGAMLSYVLRPEDRGWKWFVVDPDGNTVAYGADVDRNAAQAALRRAYMAAAKNGAVLSIAA